MNQRQVPVVGRSLLGGVLGAALGIAIGGLTGAAMVEPPPRDERLPLTTGFFNFLGGVLEMGAVVGGAGAGGVVGAIAGSMLGVGTGAQRAAAGTRTSPMAEPPDGLELEAARLRARLAEIEQQRKRRTDG